MPSMKSDPFEMDGESLVETISSLREHARSFVASKREYELLYERAPIPYLELDDRGRILRANAECESMFDGTGAPLAGKPIFHFITASEVRHLRNHLIHSNGSSRPLALHLSLVNKH